MAISPPPHPPPSRGRGRVGGIALSPREAPYNDNLFNAFVLETVPKKSENGHQRSRESWVQAAFITLLALAFVFVFISAKRRRS